MLRCGGVVQLVRSSRVGGQTRFVIKPYEFTAIPSRYSHRKSINQTFTSSTSRVGETANKPILARATSNHVPKLGLVTCTCLVILWAWRFSWLPVDSHSDLHFSTLYFQLSVSTHTSASTLLIKLAWLGVQHLEPLRRDGVCQPKRREVRAASFCHSLTALTLEAQTYRGYPRVASVKNLSQERRRSLRLQGADPIQTTLNSDQQAKTVKRPREEDKVSPGRPSLEPFPKRVRPSVDEPVSWKTISDVWINFWRETGTWPTEEQGAVMDRFRDLVDHALPKKRSKSSLRRKHSDPSINAETVPTRTTSDQQREQKSTPYRHPRYEGQLQERGSFMDEHEEGGYYSKRKALPKASANATKVT